MPRIRAVLRVVVPALLIVAWLAGASFGGPLFGKIDEVSSNDQTAYLPSSAEATEVQQRLDEFNDSDQIPAIAVFTSETPLDDEAQGLIGDAVSAASADASPALISDDGLAMQAFVPLDSPDDVPQLGETLRADAPAGVTVQITGPAGFSADLKSGFAGIDGLLLGVALGAVLVILVLVYRSAFLPFVVLATSLFALCVALLVVWWLAKWDVLLLSGQTQGILFILVIGAATDYALLFVSRFREALRHTTDRAHAIRTAWRGSLEPIAASGGTVIAGLLCLLLSDLKSNSTLGPVAAIGIVFAMLSALTLLPALLYTFGRAVFWPRRISEDRPERDADPVESATLASARASREGAGLPAARTLPAPRTASDPRPTGLWGRLGSLIARRPRVIWIATTLVLLAGVAAVPQLKADGVPQSDLVLGASEARDGQAALGEHFPGGSGSPASIVVPETAWQDAADILLAADGVSDVSISSTDSPSGSAPVTEDGITGFGGSTPTPTVSGGDVLLQATLTDAADSEAAAETVRALRDSLHDTGAIVGGVTATAIDTNDASVHDRNLIIPVVLGVILVILMLLLRSILAPILLILTTVLSFGTAMGVSALIFNHVLGFPGADPAVPLYGFVFLVALGIDYNIFLMTRVREESLAYGTRSGILRGLSATGGVITSAGIVLAATFAALGVIPILFLAQLAFIVAFGVLLDTFVVRSLLVPALAYDIGRKIWWPAKMR
ncbi:RND superfamily drug exporter [Microbacterium sorbitolivorans]|uniref:MMPL family transporter n=1 Tax=Microbacterium sorbitolivorans TaxID=1867410 RepID=A0A367XT25_9MICO|nr:MMPL family transporter [Microbacterium sorbitolivorans]RCK56783.1 MMPL family transporter [Microbacterium sorbitolivorans]GGF50220.1 RND superfamily drug exporter [Microbacterium sorbitolivorans]